MTEVAKQWECVQWEKKKGQDIIIKDINFKNWIEEKPAKASENELQ